ncbi:hydroxymethylbilane synthase [Serpentinicella alkaliphila]|uniref:Porphobilinogen deaminase n=1 Tax=Serpentinicella alkaliphila TaxID=1734049 RepID=A0A4R2U520_9FIRM|nr:hydroxymethylbilane synthase [Serpentinicella alkaliphila]QUH27101.1 hydroxymethylbilane synthase [Serpentinicella alkaliphila]TCQ05229.1 hydroxymethylbilane synthase [Serpentinicella alkaliphila]
MNKLKIGTRGSKLALRQTEIIIENLKKLYVDIEFEIIQIKTTGDKILDRSLSKIGGKGIFIKEIEDALLNRDIDIAVHSLKDMPAEVPEGLVIAAYTEREDPTDCLISKDNMKLDQLPRGSVIGTSSLRRICQLKALRPDLEYKPLRGNILTRIKKLDEGEFDAIVLASAGLIRLGLQNRIAQKFEINEFIPAVCQGIICVEVRNDDDEVLNIIKAIDNKVSRIIAECERSFLKHLNGSCQIPLGAYCQINGNELFINGILGDSESGSLYRDSMRGTIEKASELGQSLAMSVKAKSLE